MLTNKEINTEEKILKELEKYPNKVVREAIKEVNGDLDKLLSHPKDDVRKSLAEYGYGLEVLKTDISSKVRHVAILNTLKKTTFLKYQNIIERTLIICFCVFGLISTIFKTFFSNSILETIAYPIMKIGLISITLALFYSIFMFIYVDIKSYNYTKVSMGKDDNLLNNLIHNYDEEVRQVAIKNADNLDQLIKHPNWKIRFALVQEGYKLEEFVFDENPTIRRVVAQMGNSLDVLTEDEDMFVKREAKKSVYKKSKLHINLWKIGLFLSSVFTVGGFIPLLCTLLTTNLEVFRNSVPLGFINFVLCFLLGPFVLLLFGCLDHFFEDLMINFYQPKSDN